MANVGCGCTLVWVGHGMITAAGRGSKPRLAALSMRTQSCMNERACVPPSDIHAVKQDH